MISTLDRLEQVLDDPDQVSGEQREAVLAEGDFLLIACPGSGKTRTSGLRAAWWGLIDSPRKIAVTSYTNVAVAEIRASSSSVGLPLGEPHFCGTLHSLLLRMVFYPFGHLVMSCDAQPVVVPDGQPMPIEISDVRLGDNRLWAPISAFHFQPDGTFTATSQPSSPLSPVEMVARGADHARKLKRELFAQGFASFSDSMYVAKEVLENYPNLTELIARRFDEIIVDEVQDTSGVQLRCLSLLRNPGNLQSLVMVGDPDQAIYEWQGSDPNACRKFADDHALTTLELTANFRSSQAICDVTHRLSSRPTPETARGPWHDADIPPEVWLYDATDPQSAVEAFRSRLDEFGIRHDMAPVLVRNRALANKLNRLTDVSMSWQVRSLGNAAATFEISGTFESRSLSGVEETLRRLAWGPGELIMGQRLGLRDAASKLVTLLPPISDGRPLKEWIASARDVVNRAVKALTADPAAKVSNVVKARAGDDKRPANSVFPTTGATLTVRTVHSAKGESHDAVLLLAGRAFGDRDSARDWIKAELGEDRDEETRIGYVGLTRARRYCAVGLPDSTPAELLDAYEGAGFSRQESK